MRKTAVIVFCLFCAIVLLAQVPIFAGQPYASLTNATSTGPGAYFSVSPSNSFYTWTVSTTGAVSAASVNLEGSIAAPGTIPGASSYAPLDVAASTDTQWAVTTAGVAEMRHVVNKSVNFVRCNVTSISGGGSIGCVIEAVH